MTQKNGVEVLGDFFQGIASGVRQQCHVDQVVLGLEMCVCVCEREREREKQNAGECLRVREI